MIKSIFFSPAPVSGSWLQRNPARRRFRLIDEILNKFIQGIRSTLNPAVPAPALIKANPKPSHTTLPIRKF